MERAPRSHRRNVSFHQTVFTLRKESCDSQRCKCQDVVAAHLEERKHVRLLKELKDPVCKSHQHSCLRSVPVRRQHDKEHAAQSHAAAPGHLKDLQIRGDKRQSHRHCAEHKLLRPHSLFLRNLSCKCDRSHEKKDPRDNTYRISGSRKPAVRCNKKIKHKKFPPILRIENKRAVNSRLARESWRGIRVGISRHNTSPNPCAFSRSVYQIGNPLSDNASLRWHYPNQVMGRSSQLPLSLYCKLPLSSILCNFMSDIMLNVSGGNVKLCISSCSLRHQYFPCFHILFPCWNKVRYLIFPRIVPAISPARFTGISVYFRSRLSASSGKSFSFSRFSIELFFT